MFMTLLSNCPDLLVNCRYSIGNLLQLEKLALESIFSANGGNETGIFENLELICW